MNQTIKEKNYQTLQRCRSGDRKAQFEIYQQYSKAMFNTALRIVHDTADAEDALQEAFIAAFNTLDRWEEKSTFGAWLKRIVINKSLDAMQKKKVSLVSIDDVKLNGYHDESPVDFDPSHSLEEVMAAIDRLPNGFRVVLSLYLLEGYDHAEIAEILGITESGSKSQYHRAKQKVQQILKEKSHVR